MCLFVLLMMVLFLLMALMMRLLGHIIIVVGGPELGMGVSLLDGLLESCDIFWGFFTVRTTLRAVIHVDFAHDNWLVVVHIDLSSWGITISSVVIPSIVASENGIWVFSEGPVVLSLFLELSFSHWFRCHSTLVFVFEVHLLLNKIQFSLFFPNRHQVLLDERSIRGVNEAEYCQRNSSFHF